MAKKPSPPPKPEAPVTIDNASIITVRDGKVTNPCLLYDSDVDLVDGCTVRFALDNGVTYQGVVASRVRVDSQIMAEFTGGIKPVRPK